MSRQDRELQLDRRHLLRVLAGLAAVGAAGSVAGCASLPVGNEMEHPSGRTIRIGLVRPSGGAFAGIGRDIERGFLLYLGDHGGLLGRHWVDLLTAEETRREELDRLLGQDVLALAGVADPQALSEYAGQVQAARIPLVSSYAAPSAFTSQLYVWRASSVEGEAGMALAPYSRRLGESAFLLFEDTSQGRAEASAFRRTFTDLGGRIAGEAAGTGGLGSALQQAAFSGSGAVFAAVSGSVAADLLVAYRDLGLEERLPLIGPHTLTETVDLRALGRLPTEVYTSSYYAADLDNAENRRFVASYHKAHRVQPTGYAEAAYDSAAVLDKALRLVPDVPTPIGLNQAFSLLGQIESPRGTWVFNQNRTPQQKWYLRRLGYDGQVPGNVLDTDLSVLS